MDRLPTIKVILLFALIAPACAPSAHSSNLADIAPDSCSGPEIVRFDMPVEHGRPNGDKFSYALQIHHGTNPAAPLVVYMPGGPGYNSIGQGVPSVNVPALSTDMNYILTDQRSTGCNANSGAFPVDSLTSDNMAADVADAIVALKLDNYVLFGWSFGSLHATKVAAKLEQMKAKGAAVTLPKKVVLESVIGRALKPGEAIANAEGAWDEVKVFLTPNVLAQLSAPTLPFADAMPAGQAPIRWGQYILGQLYVGFWSGDLTHQLTALDHGSADSLRSAVVNSIPEGYSDLFTTIQCREIDESFFNTLALSDGKLTKVDGLCGEQKFTTRYDSAEQQISVPIVYISGEADPATPVWQARYHFDHQVHADRTLLRVPRGGHFTFGNTLALCRGALWSSLLSDGQDLRSTLRGCPGVARVTEERPDDSPGLILGIEWQ